MLKHFFRRAVPVAPRSLAAAAAAPAPLPPVPAVPLWPDKYPPRLTNAPVYFDCSFHLRLARAYHDHWASESSLLATPTNPVSIWVRNQRDELVAHHVFTSAPIDLGLPWWPGIYSVQVEHPDFREVLCAVKQGPWCPPMPPLDLLAPLHGATYPPAPCASLSAGASPVDVDTSAQLVS
ncbi:hypothetical protein GKZ68_20750 (plasmid) [Hymenobacter sp. BRD128]|uniref:hypothetical protein n=1 Tax=Hymenobacter sp. BRD128 TaxID=2675878 RepID=UPI001564CCD9|nr:hypothetical protein [Hymenobacter sp. BRD128]QKG59114.1 hypothetical protein GKZ68_20750 [Hymenobacter sp. BRD128]